MWLKKTVSFCSANLVGQVVRIIQELVIRAVLAPHIMGLWDYVLVVRNFGTSLDLGTLTAMLRKLCLLHGAQNAKDIGAYRKTAFVLHLFQQALVGLGIVAYAFLVNRGTEYFWPMIAGAVILLLGGFGEVFKFFYQGAARYTQLSWRLLIFWPIYAALLIAGVCIGQVYGLIVAMICAMAIQAFILGFGAQGDTLGVEHKWDRGAAMSLLSVGVPFRIVDYPMTLHQMVDVLFVVNFLGIELLAIYSTAKMVLLQTRQLPTWISTVIVTRLTQETGANHKSRKELGDIVFSYLRLYYLAIVPMLICASSAGAAIVFAKFIPKYEDALGPMLVLLFVLYFAPYATLIRRFWLIDKRFGALLVSNVVALASVLVGLAILLVIRITTPTSVATVFLLSHVIYFMYLLWALGPELWSKKKLASVVLFVSVSIAVTFLALKTGGVFEWKDDIPGLAGIALACLKEVAVLFPLVLFGLLPEAVPVLRTRFGGNRNNIIGPSV